MSTRAASLRYALLRIPVPVITDTAAPVSDATMAGRVRLRSDSVASLYLKPRATFSHVSSQNANFRSAMRCCGLTESALVPVLR